MSVGKRRDFLACSFFCPFSQGGTVQMSLLCFHFLFWPHTPTHPHKKCDSRNLWMASLASKYSRTPQSHLCLLTPDPFHIHFTTKTLFNFYYCLTHYILLENHLSLSSSASYSSSMSWAASHISFYREAF